jgi:hypothetical protein
MIKLRISTAKSCGLMMEMENDNKNYFHLGPGFSGKEGFL